MPLRPEDVSHKRFTPVRLREGYDMGEVDQFLDEVEAELSRLTGENDELRSQVSAAQAGAPAPDGSAASAAAGSRQGDEPPEATDRTAAEEPGEEDDAGQPTAEQSPAVGAAEGTSGGTAPAGAVAGAASAATDAGGVETLQVHTAAEASSAAARLLEIATRNADELVSDARTEAEQILGEARTKAERLESEAKEKSDQVEADARNRAEMLDSETAERRAQLVGELERERDQLSTEVEGLRQFEREYRSRLKNYFTEQLESLGASQGVEPAADSSPQGVADRSQSVAGDAES